MGLENLEFSEDLEFSENLRGGTHVRFDKEINFGDIDVDPDQVLHSLDNLTFDIDPDIAISVDYSINIKGFTEYSLLVTPPIIG